jgi:hydroxyethylthiazole kinase-like uncharacterized protein yjeF
MKLLTAGAMKEADRKTIEELGLPGAVLMETAGMRVTEAMIAKVPPPARVVVLAGPGNNGGDGLVAARQLQRAGYRVSLWSTVAPGAYRGDAAINYNFLMHSGFLIRHILKEADLKELKADLQGTAVVVDALLGIGVDRPVEGLLAGVIDAVNESGIPVLAVDVPSGIYADTGSAPGSAIKARWTVTFAFPKRGLMFFPGAELAGEILVADIFIPSFLVDDEPVAVSRIEQVQALLPPRRPDAHKGSFGRVMIAAGSPGMSGAAVLAGRAALRGGAGLVYLAVPSSVRPAVENKLVEVIVRELPELQPGIPAAAAVKTLLNLSSECRVLAVGPGLPAEAGAFVKELVEECPLPMVIDAGALGALENNPDILLKARHQPVITPHAGEMARLTGSSPEAVQQNRLEVAGEYAARWNAVVVLKGAYTVIAAPDGKMWVNPTGGPVLASAGTGDLLTGLIAALIAQGLTPLDAAVVGAFIHGLAGDLLKPARGRVAGDVLKNFSKAFDYLAGGEQAYKGPGRFIRRLKPVW